MKKLLIAVFLSGFSMVWAQTSPTPIGIDLDPLGRPLRIQSYNPEFQTLEVLTFTWGDDFLSQTLSTQDGVVLFMEKEHLEDNNEDGEVKTLDSFRYVDGRNVIEIIIKYEAEDFETELISTISYNKLEEDLKFEWTNDVLEDEEETKVAAAAFVQAIKDNGFDAALLRVAKFYLRVAPSMDQDTLEILFSLSTMVGYTTFFEGDDWLECTSECIEDGGGASGGSPDPVQVCCAMSLAGGVLPAACCLAVGWAAMALVLSCVAGCGVGGF